MARVTSKLQVTVPKAIADRYGIAPGQELEWLEAGDGIRVVPERARTRTDPGARLAVFDRATERQRARERATTSEPHADDRGWRREELYERAGAG
jgi:AbrB family looped-hinge helix DNA binding protein